MISTNRNFSYPKTDTSNMSKIKTKFIKSSDYTYVGPTKEGFSSEYSTNESAKPVQINIFEKVETLSTDRFPIPVDLSEEQEDFPDYESVSIISDNDEVEHPPDISFYMNDYSLLDGSKVALKITNFTKFSQDVLREINKFRTNPVHYSLKLSKEKQLDKLTDCSKANKTLPKLTLKSGLSNSAEDLMKIIILHEGYELNSIGETLFVSKVNMINSRVNKHGLALGEPIEIVIINSIDTSPGQLVLNLLTAEDKASQMKRAALLDPEVNYTGICCDVTPRNSLCTVINLVSHYYQPGDDMPRNFSMNKQPKLRSNSSSYKKTNLSGVKLKQTTHSPGTQMINPIQSLRGSPSDSPSKFDVLSRFNSSFSSSTFSSRRSNTHKVCELNPIIKLYVDPDEK